MKRIGTPLCIILAAVFVSAPPLAPTPAMAATGDRTVTLTLTCTNNTCQGHWSRYQGGTGAGTSGAAGLTRPPAWPHLARRMTNTVAFEAAFGWSWLVDLLEDYGFEAHLVHPLRCKAIASARLKNDKGRRRDPGAAAPRGPAARGVDRPGQGPPAPRAAAAPDQPGPARHPGAEPDPRSGRRPRL